MVQGQARIYSVTMLNFLQVENKIVFVISGHFRIIHYITDILLLDIVLVRAQVNVCCKKEENICCFHFPFPTIILIYLCSYF